MNQVKFLDATPLQTKVIKP